MKPVSPILDFNPAKEPGFLTGLPSPKLFQRRGRSRQARRSLNIHTLTVDDFKAPVTVRMAPARPHRAGIRLWGQRRSQQLGDLSLAGRSVPPAQPIIGGWNLDNFMAEAPYSARRYLTQSSYQTKRTCLRLEVGLNSRLEERAS